MKAKATSKMTAEGNVFLDPNAFSKDGTTSLAGIEFSSDGSHAAYQLSEGGSDWRKVVVVHTDNPERPLEDTLRDVKFSGLSWRGNEGFYYSSYDKPKSGSALSGKTSEHKLYFHKLGTPQSQDVLVFGGSTTPRRYIGGGVTENGAFLVITAAVSTTGNELYVQDLRAPNAPIVRLFEGFEFENNPVHADGQSLYIQTTWGAPNGRMMRCILDRPEPNQWEEIIAERPYPITVGTGGGFFVVNGLKDALSVVDRVSVDGKEVVSVPLPGQGTVSGVGGKWNARELYFSFTNAVTPGTQYRYAPRANAVELYRASSIDFNSADYVSYQVFYTSKDGTKVPMMITHKKGLKYTKKNPTILYGYGGFGVNLTPSFSTSYVVWLENGGVLAIPNLRGGGEYGEVWHKAGTQLQKQNVFDDFVAEDHIVQAFGPFWRFQRRVAGGRGDDAASGVGPRGLPRSRGFGHVALPYVYGGCRLGVRLRNVRTKCGDVPLLAGLQPGAQRKKGNVLPGHFGDHRGPRRPGGSGAFVQVCGGAAGQAGLC
jgi:prolyl oligopeptidase